MEHWEQAEESDADESNCSAESEWTNAYLLRHRRKLIKPFRHILTDITDPETKMRLVEKIRHCLDVMEEHLNHRTTVTSACRLEAHPIMGPPLMELYKAGIVLPRVIRAKDVIEVLERVAFYLGKRRPRCDPPGFMMGHQYVKQVDDLREIFQRPRSFLSKRLAQMKYDLNATCSLKEGYLDTSDCSD